MNGNISMQYLKDKVKHQKLSIHSKLLVFRHVLRLVGYSVFLDLEITIDPRKLIFQKTKIPTQGFTMLPKRKKCVVCVVRYSHLLLRAPNVIVLYIIPTILYRSNLK